MAWRGRGRGTGGPVPHNSTNGGEIEPEGPPPLFPDMVIPELPPATSEDQVLVQHWRALTKSFQASCYHLDPKSEKRKPLDDPYALSKEPAGKAQKMPLTSILTLDAKFFPEELFTSSQKRAAARASAVPIPDHKKASGEADIFERFAALEKSGAKGEEGAGQERRAGGNLPSREGQRGQEHEDGEEELAEEDDEEDGFNDEMDLVMNENFDDDEGYMDDDDGGDGEGTY